MGLPPEKWKDTWDKIKANQRAEAKLENRVRNTEQPEANLGFHWLLGCHPSDKLRHLDFLKITYCRNIVIYSTDLLW